MHNLDKIDLHNIKLEDLMEVLDKCVGPVYLLTDDGNRLNLKSKLCQIVGLTKLIEHGVISDVYLFAPEAEDDTRLFRFKLYKEI